ncbi:protein serine/threonine phosphatase 2C, partial [Fragilariopsis cylindrus CCMP1102]
RPIDLTTDHSAYNPAEVTAVLRRCNNCPRAISSGMGGGIKRVAGSLAVTRALGDAYLKTPQLSFFPYKTHSPYITARPEVNCRHIVKGEGGDKVVVLATDGVWERAGGEDILRWARTRNSTVAEVIVNRVLNKVRRARNIKSLHALMSLPPGRARRSKHDDITASVVDLS